MADGKKEYKGFLFTSKRKILQADPAVKKVTKVDTKEAVKSKDSK